MNTKDIIKALKTNAARVRLVIQADKYESPSGSWSGELIIHIDDSKKEVFKVNAMCNAHCFYASDAPSVADSYRPRIGEWSLSYNDKLITALEAVPKDCAWFFKVSLDAGTNGYCRDPKLHCDTLAIVWTETKYKKQFRHEIMIDFSITQHNTNRFGLEGYHNL